MQSMIEEAVKLKFDLRHTLSTQNWVEGREDGARKSLRAVKIELREVKDRLQAAQNDLLEVRDGMQSAQSELQVVRDELFTSQSELQGSKEELCAARDELCNKTTLLDGARREASEAISYVERLTKECHGLRGDLHRQDTLVIQRDEVIRRLRDKACTQWASRWLAFQRKVANVYQGLDFNFDLPRDEETEESLSTDHSGGPDTLAEAHSPSSPLLLPLMSNFLRISSLACRRRFFFFY